MEKIKDIQAIGHLNALNALAGEKLPFKISYAIQKNAVNLEAIQKTVQAAFLKYKDSFPINTEPNVALIEQDFMTEIADQESEVKIYKVHVSEFDGISLTPAQVASISFMIKEDEQ